MSAIGLAVFGVGLAGCGQRGPLYLPTDPAAANRATLPQVLVPGTPRSPGTTQPPAQGDRPASETNEQNNNPPNTNTTR